VAAFTVGTHVGGVALVTERAQHLCGPVRGVSGVTEIGRIAFVRDRGSRSDVTVGVTG
jgi:hypothetical protein